jgi:hypothetical protein
VIDSKPIGKKIKERRREGEKREGKEKKGREIPLRLILSCPP